MKTEIQKNKRKVSVKRKVQANKRKVGFEAKSTLWTRGEPWWAGGQ